MISKETTHMFKYEDLEGNVLKMIRHQYKPTFVINMEKHHEDKVINQMQLYIPDTFDLRIIIASLEELMATNNLETEGTDEH